MNQITDPTELTTRFQEAWNTHDMDAFGRLFYPDATFVNRFGSYWRGVDEIVAVTQASTSGSIRIQLSKMTRLTSIKSPTMWRSYISGRDSAPVPRILPDHIRSTR
jgi:hypothetical protein